MVIIILLLMIFADGFGLNKLRDTITDKRRCGYKEGDHYKYFMVENKKNKLVKKLYLKAAGFFRLAGSTQMFDEITSKNIIRWITQFIVQDNGQFLVDKANSNRNKQFGFTYCVSSPILHGSKIGFWTGTMLGLKSRFKTYYGKDLELFFVETYHPYLLEQKCMKYFDKYNISGELFQKKYKNEYITFLKNNIINTPLNTPLNKAVSIKHDEQYDILPDPIEDIHDINIQVVGKREVDGCYFNAIDMFEHFELKTTCSNIINSEKYINGIDYKYFIDGNIKKLYLTYNGFLKILF